MTDPIPDDLVSHTVDHLFRRESGRLVAILARRFGTAHLQLAEDVVQEALLRAMEVWPFSGVPENPSAWLLETARNRAYDALRRGRVLAKHAAIIAPLIEDCARDALSSPPPHFEDEIADSQLRMIFVCCQPALPADAQVALVLKILCGFGEREIGAAFLISAAATAKKLVRARKLLRDAQVPVELPPESQLANRVETVLHALYLLFNEGYKASDGQSLLRADLCAEAIRLGELLVQSPLGDRPETHALLALMLCHNARLPGRVADDGSLLVLAEQNRACWDQRQIQRGLLHLGKSAGGAKVTRWHLEAGIAVCHALAPNFEFTNWPHILSLYDDLARIDASPVIALNRAIALAQVRGPQAGLDELERVSSETVLQNYYLLHAVKGQLLLDARRPEEAAVALRQALALSPQPAERELLQKRLAACSA